jgi:pimeloyl-ACP methyl ester carboxylesterase
LLPNRDVFCRITFILENPFDYTPVGSDFNLKQIEDGQRCRRYELSFRPASANPRIGGDSAQAEYYQPVHVSRAPLVIIAHGMGDTSRIPASMLARSLSNHGWARLVPYLTAHSSRTPQVNEPKTLSPDDWFELYRTSVIEIRQMLDWAEGRAEIDSQRIAIIGISFGGFVSAITMALDERLKTGILIVSGGHALKINQLSATMRRHYPGPPVDYERRENEYQAYLRDVAQQGVWRVTPPWRNFLLDPLTFAPLLQRRPLLMINALWDSYVPREVVREMQQASKAESMMWLPAGHLTIWLYYPLIERRIRNFLQANMLGLDCS